MRSQSMRMVAITLAITGGLNLSPCYSAAARAKALNYSDPCAFHPAELTPVIAAAQDEIFFSLPNLGTAIGRHNKVQEERALISFTGFWSGYWFRFADETIVYERVPMVDLNQPADVAYDGGIILDGQYVIEETIRHAHGRLLEVALYDAEGNLLTRVSSPNGQPTYELTLSFDFNSLRDISHRFRVIQAAQVTKRVKIKVGVGDLEITIPQGPKGKGKLACIGSSDSPDGTSREEERGQESVNTCDGNATTLTKDCLVGKEFSVPTGEAANALVCVKDEERLRMQTNTCSVEACVHGTVRWKQTIYPMKRNAVVHWVDKDGNQVGGPKVYTLPFLSYGPCVCEKTTQPYPSPCPPTGCSAEIRVVSVSTGSLDGVEVIVSDTRHPAVQYRGISRAGRLFLHNLSAGQYSVVVHQESLRSLGVDPKRARIFVVPETLTIPEPCPLAATQNPQIVVILIFP